MEVPFFGLKRESAALREDLLTGFSRVLDHGQVLQSEEVEEFESTVAKMTQRRFAVATNSCTDSLYFALKTAGVSADDEVIVPAFSFIATASCVLRAGATPKFVDVTEQGNIHAGSLRHAVTERTKAIIYVHMFGFVDEKNFNQIKSTADQYQIPIIEDCAQAFGSVGSISRAPAGSFGEISCISFDPTKVISALGSGGIFLTDIEEHARHARKLRYHGKDQSGVFETLGFNSQMPATTAASLIVKLANDREWRVRRQEIAKTYISNFRDLPVKLPMVEDIESHNYHKFVVLLEQRAKAYERLRQSGVQVMIHYRDPLPNHKTFAEYKDQLLICKNARTMSATCLSLPCHAFLTNDETEYVIEKFRALFEKNTSDSKEALNGN